MSLSLLERITTRLSVLSEQAERLRELLAEAEEEVDRLRATEQVVKELLAEEAEDRGLLDDDEPSPFYRVQLTPARAAEQLAQGIELRPVCAPAPLPVCAPMPAPGGLLIPYRQHAAGAEDLPADYQALLSAVRAAPGPLICKQVCEQLGLPLEAGQVEGVRAKLKRLAERGRLRKAPTGAFAA